MGSQHVKGCQGSYILFGLLFYLVWGLQLDRWQGVSSLASEPTGATEDKEIVPWAALGKDTENMLVLITLISSSTGT